MLNHITPHSGVILEPSTAGQPPLQPPAPAAAPIAQEKKPTLSKVLKGVAAPSIFGEQRKYQIKTQNIKHYLKNSTYLNLINTEVIEH